MGASVPVSWPRDRRRRGDDGNRGDASTVYADRWRPRKRWGNAKSRMGSGRHHHYRRYPQWWSMWIHLGTLATRGTVLRRDA